MYIDSHCHLNHNRLLHLGTPSEVIGNAKSAGVDGMLTICCRIREEMDTLKEIANDHENVWCTVGTHPHDAGNPAEKDISFDELVEIAKSDPKIVGIGESGLDYFYKHSDPDDQQESFRKHIRACIETDLPLVVHARDADEDIMRIIREEGRGTNLQGVMHCFSSGRAMGEDALDFGFYISFSGILTFKNADELRDFADDVPMERLLVETDAPFLTPEPDRKHINEPARVVHTAKVLASVKDVSEDLLAKQTTENFFTLFKAAKDTRI